MSICEERVTLRLYRGLRGIDRYWKCQRWNGVFCLCLAISHGLQSLLETCVCYFWLMTVLGFRGPLDSESYMPTGVSQKVVDLIGCIRVCVCVCACVSPCTLDCEVNRMWTKLRNYVFLSVRRGTCFYICVCLTFPCCSSWVSRLKFRHSVDSIFFL